MTKVEERISAIEKALDEMRQAVARLSVQQTEHLESMARIAADVAELQTAIRQVKNQLGGGPGGSRVTSYS